MDPKHETNTSIVTEAAIKPQEIKKSKSFRADAIRRFKKSPTGIIGLIIIGLFVFMAIFGPWLMPHEPFEQDFSRSHQSPNIDHPMGTDFFGRDIFSRVIHGARISLCIGLIVIALRMAIGVTIGLISGYFGGIVGTVLMRVVDAFMAFPGIILALAIMAVRGQGLENVVIAMSATGWTTYARLVRSEVISLKEREYVQAARGLGFNNLRVMFRHIIPNALPSIIVYSSMTLGTIITGEAGLSFLGLGASASDATWGIQMSLERDYLRYAWWGVTFPGGVVATIVLGFNLLGDALRDVWDPRLKE